MAGRIQTVYLVGLRTNSAPARGSSWRSTWLSSKYACSSLPWPSSGHLLQAAPWPTSLQQTGQLNIPTLPSNFRATANQMSYITVDFGCVCTGCVCFIASFARHLYARACNWMVRLVIGPADDLGSFAVTPKCAPLMAFRLRPDEGGFLGQSKNKTNSRKSTGQEGGPSSRVACWCAQPSSLALHYRAQHCLWCGREGIPHDTQCKWSLHLHALPAAWNLAGTQDGDPGAAGAALLADLLSGKRGLHAPWFPPHVVWMAGGSGCTTAV